MHTSTYFVVLISVLLPLLANGKSTKSSLEPTSTEPTVEQYWNFIQSSTSLQHGDPCSWQDEEARQEEIRQTQNLLKTSSLRREIFNQFVKDSLDQGRKFCTALKRLVCDQTTEKCVCGETAAQVGLGDAYKPSSYILEKNEEGGQRVCRLGRGTACSPPKTPEVKTETSIYRNKLASSAGFDLGPSCAGGLNCVAVGKGKLCNNMTMIEYVFDHMMGKKDQLTFGEVKENLLSGKVCACLDEGELDNELPDDKNDNVQESGNGRDKRAVEVEKDMYDRAINSLYNQFD